MSLDPVYTLSPAMRECGKTAMLLSGDDVQLEPVSRLVSPRQIGGDADGEVYFIVCSALGPILNLYFENDGRILLDKNGEIIALWPVEVRDSSRTSDELDSMNSKTARKGQETILESKSPKQTPARP